MTVVTGVPDGTPTQWSTWATGFAYPHCPVKVRYSKWAHWRGIGCPSPKAEAAATKSGFAHRLG